MASFYDHRVYRRVVTAVLC